MIRWIGVLALGFYSLMGCTSASKDYITIVAAANMQFALEEIIEEFERQFGIKTQLTTSSSGKLTAQIREGAPYDIFVSADMKYPNELERLGLALMPPKIYARGQLALWSIHSEWEVNLAGLSAANIAHIAIANPKTAPYGLAAIQTLERLQILENIQNKLVFGESVSQTNQFIVTGSVDVGLTALSVLKSPQLKGQSNWITVDTALYDPILQGAIIINATPKLEKAMAFFDFLFTPSAKDILNKYGYITP